jgi:hypothetical protein
LVLGSWNWGKIVDSGLVGCMHFSGQWPMLVRFVRAQRALPFGC